MLPENDTPSDIDRPASSALMEDKNFEGKDDLVGSSVVCEPSQGTSSEPVNPVDDSQGCGVVSDIVSENVDPPQQSSATEDNNDSAGLNGSIVAPEKSDSQVKAGVASPVCETLPECENKDLPACSSTQAHENVNGSPEDGPVGSLVKPEETKESEN